MGVSVSPFSKLFLESLSPNDTIKLLIIRGTRKTLVFVMHHSGPETLKFHSAL